MAPQKFARAPVDKPDFTVKTLRDAIPKHCFERSLLRSFGSLFGDVAVVACLAYAALWIDHPSVPTAAKYALWPVYWFWQGAFCTGIWVLAHECGHGAFSKYQWVNDSVGMIFHSALLVPYYSWKHSHRRHHSNTGSNDKDEVFVPHKIDPETRVTSLTDTTAFRLLALTVTLTVGWPLYLTINISGRPYPRWASHFDPTSPIFSKRERLEIVISDLGLAAAIAALTALGRATSPLFVVKMYLVPYFIVNFWLVMITLLQHTHPSLPHYDEGEWDWLRGALSTVDRSYGFLDHIFHHIADTHVTHHLFSQLPHYHAQEATRALKGVLGKYYVRDHRNVFVALFQDWFNCAHVVPDSPGGKIHWFVR